MYFIELLSLLVPLAQKCASLRMLEDMKGRCEVSEGYVFLDALSHLLKEKSVSSCCFDENEFISLIEKSMFHILHVTCR